MLKKEKPICLDPIWKTCRRAIIPNLNHLKTSKKQKIACITLLVKDYDEAIAFYTRKLDFDLLEDTDLGAGKRWVRVAPKGAEASCSLLLAKAVTERQFAALGDQAGGRVFLFLFTDNFEYDYQRLIDEGITIVREPKKEPYGTLAVFADLYGNLWDLLQPVTF